MESRLQSAAAFVEGGVQDSCDDACSICLEEFCVTDPSTLTCCRHEFHLQCILEWCQRSSQCPMCWQALSLRDPTSQELLEAVERERSIRVNRSRAVFHHPALGDFEVQHLPVSANDSELEERIIQHLAAAAAMGRPHHIARREGQRGRPSTQVHPHDNTANPSAFHAGRGAPQRQASHIIHGQSDEANSGSASNRLAFSNSRSFAGQSSLTNQDCAGPSDFQSISESLKSHLSAVSMKYKDSITKSTRGWNGWRERFFSRNASMSDIGSEVKREVNAGIATVSRIMERLDMKDNSSAVGSSASQNIQGHAATEIDNGTLSGSRHMAPSCAASSSPN